MDVYGGKKWKTVKESCEERSICRKTLMRIAGDAGAIIRIGRMVRIDVGKLDSYTASINR